MLHRIKLNTFSALLLEVCVSASGFVISKLIISEYGSACNGLLSSITQWLSFITLLSAGVTAVTKSALFKPLAKHNHQEISSILKACELFLRKVVAMYCLYLVVVVFILPILVSQEFKKQFTVSLILIISITSIVQYCFGLTYQTLLEADQRKYIINTLFTIAYIINMSIAFFLIRNHNSVLIVKAVWTVIFAGVPITINIYVRQKYYILYKIAPDYTPISQRWSAFAHTLAGYIHSSTDFFVLTVFSTVTEISVYQVYSMIIIGMRKVVTTFDSGMYAAFGKMIATGEKQKLNDSVRAFECLIFYISTILFSSTLILIVSFVKIYTINVFDVNYNRPIFALFLVIAEMMYCLRIPYKSLVVASGCYKQTKKYAIAEAIINLCISLFLVRKFGITGVAIGTCCAMAFSTILIATYASKNILHRVNNVFWKRMSVTAICLCISCFTSKVIGGMADDSWIHWIINGILAFTETTGITTFLFIMVFPSDMKKMKQYALTRGKNK